jgi:hypothetical protein
MKGNTLDQGEIGMVTTRPQDHGKTGRRTEAEEAETKTRTTMAGTETSTETATEMTTDMIRARLIEAIEIVTETGFGTGTRSAMVIVGIETDELIFGSKM